MGINFKFIKLVCLKREYPCECIVVFFDHSVQVITSQRCDDGRLDRGWRYISRGTSKDSQFLFRLIELTR